VKSLTAAMRARCTLCSAPAPAFEMTARQASGGRFSVVRPVVARLAVGRLLARFETDARLPSLPRNLASSRARISDSAWVAAISAVGRFGESLSFDFMIVPTPFEQPACQTTRFALHTPQRRENSALVFRTASAATFPGVAETWQPQSGHCSVCATGVALFMHREMSAQAELAKLLLKGDARNAEGARGT